MRPTSPGKRYEWFSICSAHWDYNCNCRLCDAGEWRHRWRTKLSQLAFEISPRLWRFAVNVGHGRNPANEVLLLRQALQAVAHNYSATGYADGPILLCWCTWHPRNEGAHCEQCVQARRALEESGE